MSRKNAKNETEKAEAKRLVAELQEQGKEARLHWDGEGWTVKTYEDGMRPAYTEARERTHADMAKDDIRRALKKTVRDYSDKPRCPRCMMRSRNFQLYKSHLRRCNACDTNWNPETGEIHKPVYR